MTSTLHQIFDSRAGRAGSAIDADAVLDEVRGRAARRARRQRNLATGGTGLVLVAALAIGVAVLRPGGEPSPARPDVPAGGSATTPAPARSALDPVAPAPASAEVSIRLVPAGWVLLGARGPVTLYGPPSLVGSSMNNFGGKLVVEVAERYETAEPHPLTIAGRPAVSFDRTTPDSYQGVEVVVDAKTVVNFQLPDSLTLSRADVLRLANTLDIRSTAEKTHG